MSEDYKPRILNVLVWPNERLKQKSKPVTVFDDALSNYAKDLFTTMAVYGGVGLSAPQVGRLEQIIALRVEDDKPIVLINPIITVIGNEMYQWEEGCLSVPGYFKKRKRPKNIAVRFKDTSGATHDVQFGGLYAFAIQHEYDHLMGKCFVDDLSPFFYHKKIKKKIREEHPKLEKKVAMTKIQLENQGKLS